MAQTSPSMRRQYSADPEDIVLSSVRPLQVLRSFSTESTDPPPQANDTSVTTKYRVEETHSRTAVSIHDPHNAMTVLGETDWTNFFYFTFLSVASSSATIATELSPLWMVLLLWVVSSGLFYKLKL